MNIVCLKNLCKVRILLLICVLFVSVGTYGAVYDFTPTDGGLVVNLKQGDQILLSTWVDENGNGVEDDGEEYFVCHYPSQTGGYFGYTNWDSDKGNFLKLIPQAADATEPASPSIWTIDDPVTFLYSGKNYQLDGIAYTMWSTNPGGDSYTLLTSSGNSYKYQGDLTRETNNANICNAVFVAPTNRSSVTSFDPNKTLGRDDADAQGRFNGEKGYGFLGLPYREVYWLDIPRGNAPVSYTNASVVGFNKTLSTIQYSNKEASAQPGQALYAFGNKDKHHATPRTIFRLYVLNDPLTSTCADSYYFAYDEQNYVNYNKNFNEKPEKYTYTTKKKIYTIDRLVCMERLGETKYYVSDYMFVPIPDSTYYYVGYKNKYCHTDRGDAFNSQFKKIETLPIHYLGLPAPRGAYGQMIVDTTQTGELNLGVEFQPGGYFLRTNTGRNIQLRPSDDYKTWTCEEMWHITAAYAALTIKATMFTGSEYDEHDEGADISGWSVPVVGTSVPVVGGGSIIDRDGWARIHIDNAAPNGAIEFVPANPDRHIHYNNNGCTGDTIADQYPMYGKTKVAARDARLVKGFTFLGWTTNADGTGTLYHPGDSIDLVPGTTTLYAKATYTGTIHVALSFKKADGKRYFLTHPGSDAPRFSRARHIDEWTDAYQGMANAYNVDNRYINTFKVLTHPDPCAECAADEVVLDPRREMRYGAVDSLLFYENFTPGEEEYLGLYYTDPNTVLANHTWAGLFKSTGAGGRNGWPDYTVADVQNAKLSSTHYLHRVGDVLTRDERSNSSAPWIKYNAADNQFDGDASEANATVFQISRVRVADEHYVVIPDTTEEWRDEIVFGIHQGEQTEERVWSKLIGKQLMAMMKLDDDTVYFHPNPNKIITDYMTMRLNANYRLEETFEFIRDARVESLETVDEEDRPHMIGNWLDKNYFGRLIQSGLNTPVDVIYEGEYIDIVDTLRIRLRTLGPVKIKEYYGRWKEGAPGLHVLPDGSRYRDIIIRTKTAHHGAVETKLVLTPEYPVYNFNPLADDSKRLTFTLAKVLSRQLLDTDGNVLGEEILNTVDVTPSLKLAPGHCTFTSGSPSAYFSVNAEQTINDYVTLVTKSGNSEGINYDTLRINSTAIVEGVTYPVTGRVPLMQSTMSDAELVWSAYANGNRYYIMAGSGGLIFRQYELKGSTLYKKEDGKTQLVKGSANAENSDTKYITPWKYDYVDQAAQQLTLETEYGVDRYFVINGSSEPDVATTGPATLTYVYVNELVNENANFEEQVKLKYGETNWLQFTAPGGVPTLSLTTNEEEATTFSWSYLQQEYNLLNNGDYPNYDELVFGYNTTSGASVQTRYKAYRIYSMLVNNTLTYCGREDENDISDLISAGNDWKTNYTIDLISDSRFSPGASGLSKSTNTGNLTTTVTPAGDSPTDIQYGGKYVNIVDTLDVQISLQPGAPTYRFKDKWSSFTSINDAHLKIPLIRKTYHEAPFDSLICYVDRDEYNYVFPPEVTTGVNDTHTFTLGTEHKIGTNILDVDGNVVSSSATSDEHTDDMHLDDPAYADIRLADEYGNAPDWCEISDLGTNTITVHCKGNGIRAPRSANINIAYVINVKGTSRYINFRLQVAQSSRFQYAGNQNLVHSKGASGADLKDGVQQVHENKTILYYYNPSNAAQSTDQRVELPIRERNFYGWWRWYSLQPGEEDTDIPAERWQTEPSNTGKWNFPFRIIGDSVPVDPEDPSKGKKLVTQGRYTVFHYPSADYNARKDPPSKAPMLYPPQNKDTETYAVDLSVYYDNLPLSMKNINQVDIDKLDTMQNIPEPTLSLREIYELHPWTEMAERMEGYKSPEGATFPLAGERYLEDHVMMAPLGNRLLLKTEHRYSYDNIKNTGHSESLLGYYIRDDNWSTGGWDAARKDSMIWCAGWDAPCQWYTYNPKTQTYTSCSYSVTEANDFLSVPEKTSIPAGKDADTIIYCLRARSVKTATAGTLDDPDPKDPVAGDYWFNICRYKIIYHRVNKYGPKLEARVGGVDKAIITNDEIEQHYEVLERLNFDYNQPGRHYTVYPKPLPWADASYGFAYPRTAALPDNRPHNKNGLENLANMGEYNLINRIPEFGQYWHKMEQHGSAENGYMIFCDGMSSAGQVAAIELDTTLCEGQKMYFSGFVGNPYNQNGKTCPNFTFAVQGSLDGSVWEDITSYMTGDLPAANKWYQIYFPIEQNKEYTKFRVRVYNMAANDDGNDFIIDDMCIFATKPPLMVYQANTTCKNENENDSLTHVVLRVDYQGFTEDIYSLGSEYYTVQDISKSNDTTFLRLEDGYDNEVTRPAIAPSTKDTVYGKINLPNRYYTPEDGNDSVFANLQNLVNRFEDSFEEHKVNPGVEVFRKGYVFEHLDDSIRPVFYVIHTAKMSSHDTYIVHMAGASSQLLSSQCALTRKVKVRNRMILTLNGDEMPEKEVQNMCANTLYDVSLHVKGTLLMDNTAPVEVTGTCSNDWLLYGDTTKATSATTYGYDYEDIVKVIQILRADGLYGGDPNANQFARSLADVNKVEMEKIQTALGIVLSVSEEPYNILTHLVNNGYLTLYQSNMTIVTPVNDSVKYTIFPISGSGSEVMQDLNIDVCPTPVHIALKSSLGQGVPMIIGGLNRSEEESQYPIVVLADVEHANSEFAIPIDSLMMFPGTDGPKVAMKQIDFISTNDPEFHDGVDRIVLQPDRTWNLEGGENTGYYRNGNDTLLIEHTSETTYRMREGYSYTFGIEMMTNLGESGWAALGDECPVGTIPFTISVVPKYLRWDPETEDNRWNNPDNWIGINSSNTALIHEDARFAPLSSTYVVIPPMTDGRPYPVMPASIPPADSIQKVGFQYNTCHSIRFLPGGALSQQQRLEYDSVIADLSAPHDKWALRSAPIEGLLSGDIFMANTDLTSETSPWAVGPFDAAGRNYSTGNASFWLSLYSRDAIHQNHTATVDTIETEAATWSKVTNALSLELQPAQGWAVYTRTRTNGDAAVRLPKNDDTYYYYTKYGDKVYDLYESGLQKKREEIAGGADKVGKMAFYPGKAATGRNYTLSNGVAATSFVFGNPTMGYIDIWGFISDNSGVLENEIGYMNASGNYLTITKGALEEADAISSLTRYLPPMHAIVLTKKGDAATSLEVTLNTNRIVTDASQKAAVPDPAPAPKRLNGEAIKLPKGIMTVTAVNPASKRCTSRLLLGQGFNEAIIRGEDATLTTINIDNYTATSAPATPFNIYAVEGNSGLSIDLRDVIVNVPISFYNSDLPFEPISYLWFTGVNNIDGELVLYDALNDTERLILDGIRLEIETPEVSHQTRYFIRRKGFNPNGQGNQDDPIATGWDDIRTNDMKALKLIKDGHVLIIRDGHVYTMYGQQIR